MLSSTIWAFPCQPQAWSLKNVMWHQRATTCLTFGKVIKKVVAALTHAGWIRSIQLINSPTMDSPPVPNPLPHHTHTRTPEFWHYQKACLHWLSIERRPTCMLSVQSASPSFTKQGEWHSMLTYNKHDRVLCFEIKRRHLTKVSEVWKTIPWCSRQAQYTLPWAWTLQGKTSSVGVSM